MYLCVMGWYIERGGSVLGGRLVIVEQEAAVVVMLLSPVFLDYHQHSHSQSFLVS